MENTSSSAKRFTEHRHLGLTETRQIHPTHGCVSEECMIHIRDPTPLNNGPKEPNQFGLSWIGECFQTAIHLQLFVFHFLPTTLKSHSLEVQIQWIHSGILTEAHPIQTSVFPQKKVSIYHIFILQGLLLKRFIVEHILFYVNVVVPHHGPSHN